MDLRVQFHVFPRIHEESGIVHQAIKPENFLYFYHQQKLIFELSDFGIANVQAGLLPTTKPGRHKAIDNYGMLPYMAPERFRLLSVRY